MFTQLKSLVQPNLATDENALTNLLKAVDHLQDFSHDPWHWECHNQRHVDKHTLNRLRIFAVVCGVGTPPTARTPWSSYLHEENV